MMKFKNEEINGLLEEITNLDNESNMLYSDIKCLSRAKRIMEFHNLKDNSLNNLITEMNNEWDLISKNKSQKETKIKEIRNTCNHNWIEYGHDSHHTYYTCDICGKEERD